MPDLTPAMLWTLLQLCRSHATPVSLADDGKALVEAGLVKRVYRGSLPMTLRLTEEGEKVKAAALAAAREVVEGT